MATIVYLDAEDEITSAAARIRAAADSRVGLVLPFGSRVATSRINFRLLAREAMSHGRRLDIVAPDASARALAASAGLPVFASVGEYEEALDRGRREGRAPRGVARGGRDHRRGSRRGRAPAERPQRTRRRTAWRRRRCTAPAAPTADPGSVRSSGAKARGGSSARPAAVGAAAAAAGAADLGRHRPVRRARRRRRVHDPHRPTRCRSPTGAAGAAASARSSASLLVLVVVVGAVGVGAYLLLPVGVDHGHAAGSRTVGPVTFTVRADPTPRSSTRTPASCRR